MWDMFTGKQWLTTLDVASRYWQVLLSNDTYAWWKTAFVLHSGFFQFEIGLGNPAAIFERLIDYALDNLV